VTLTFARIRFVLALMVLSGAGAYDGSHWHGQLHLQGTSVPCECGVFRGGALARGDLGGDVGGREAHRQRVGGHAREDLGRRDRSRGEPFTSFRF